MAITFSRSVRSLEADKGRIVLWSLPIAAALLGGWCAWLFFARVALYEISASARLEVEQAAFPIQTASAGRIERLNLSIGRAVAAGDVLLELDAAPLRLERQQEQARLDGLIAQLAALKEEVAAHQRALTEGQQAGVLALEEARARHLEAQAAERFAREQESYVADLLGKGNASDSEYRRAKAEAEQRAAATEATRIAVPRMAKDLEMAESQRQAALDTLYREQRRLAGEVGSTEAALARLDHAIAQKRVVAPVDGVVAESAELRSGGYVLEGERVGALLPAGATRVVAYFTPAAAVGRVRPGQPARVRLDGFPWSQFGTLMAQVSDVAREMRDGQIRVELSLLEPEATLIPMEHGLPGVVEVEVERVSPASMILRIAGMRRGADAPPAAGKTVAGLAP